jgi:ankyrin repeat protein
MSMDKKSDPALRELTAVIIAGDAAKASRILKASPELARASFQHGATRAKAGEYFVGAIGRYIVAGDTALHIAAAAYGTEIAKALIAAGADVHARNRFGDQPLHAAARSHPGGILWNPAAQGATIRLLIKAGADPNATNKRGVAALHVAVRTRSAPAVRTLIECGADPKRPNGNGSTPMLLATLNTGKSGSGSAKAKAQQAEILALLGGR